MKRRVSRLPELRTASAIRAELRRRVDPDKRAFYPRFFKTGPGEYGEGDRFLGVTVPHCRDVAKRGQGIGDRALGSLMHSAIHEERHVALLILVARFNRGDEAARRRIYRYYLDHMAYVNNWDLVDVSAHVIVGGFWQGREVDAKRLWLRWAKSPNLWTRRIAMLSCYHSIRRGESTPGLDIAEALVGDEHDLIHKSVGWMLREIGKRDRKAVERFLDRHAESMPRTMLRYALEKFPESRRRHYMRRA